MRDAINIDTSYNPHLCMVVQALFFSSVHLFFELSVAPNFARPIFGDYVRLTGVSFRSPRTE